MKTPHGILALCLVISGPEFASAAPNLDAAMSHIGKVRTFLFSSPTLPNDVASARSRIAEAQKLEKAGEKLFGAPQMGEPFFSCLTFSNSLQALAGDQNNMVRNAKADAFSVNALSANAFQAGTLYTECLYELDALTAKNTKPKIIDPGNGSSSK